MLIYFRPINSLLQCNIIKNEYRTGARRVGALHFDHAGLGALMQRPNFVQGAVCMSVVAEVEVANHLVGLVLCCSFSEENELTICEAVMAIEFSNILGRVVDRHDLHEDDVVEERHVVNVRNGHKDVGVRQGLTTLPLDNTLVCPA